MRLVSTLWVGPILPFCPAEMDDLLDRLWGWCNEGDRDPEREREREAVMSSLVSDTRFGVGTYWMAAWRHCRE